MHTHTLSVVKHLIDDMKRNVPYKFQTRTVGGQLIGTDEVPGALARGIGFGLLSTPLPPASVPRALVELWCR